MAAVSGQSEMNSGQDAQSALLELDKGLRATKVGEQCEAIVKFPTLFERFPFPILINSAFLKLSDVFRVGNNFQRLCVLKVAQQSVKHLDKILSTDEFLRRIFSVMHSNDPVARAITLSIRVSLDSHDKVEVEAAIFATNQFCAKSSTFSIGICDKLTQLIEGLEIPMEMKLKLVPIFQYMYHDTESATKAWKLCTSLLATYSSKTFVVSTLNSLSLLAVACLFNIPAQIDLLLSYLISDPRYTVKRQTLLDSNMLAKKSPHIWENKHIEILCEFLASTPYINLQIGTLYVLGTLSHSPSSEILNNQQVLDVLTLQSCSESIMVCALTNEILVNIGLSRLKIDEKDRDLCEQAVINIEATIVECCLHEQSKPLEISLLCINRLVAYDMSWATNMAGTFVGLITSSSSSICLQVAKGLVSLTTQAPFCLDFVKPELFRHFEFICGLEVGENNPKAKEYQSLLVAIATLVFQSYEQCLQSPLNQKEIKEMMLKNLSVLQSSTKYWTMYRVGKQATRQGLHALAHSIFTSLTSMVASVHLHCWLKSLASFCQAESLLSEAQDTSTDITDKTSQAICCYQQGLLSLKAAVTSTQQLDFHQEYMKLRMEMLQIHVFLLGVCASIRSCPPSAVAKSFVLTTGQDTYKHSRQVIQMNECRDRFSELASKYEKFHRKSFDADPITLRTIATYEQSCLLFSNAIDLLMNRVGLPSSTNTKELVLSRKSSTNKLGQTCREMLDELQRVYVEIKGKPVSNVEIEYLSRMSVAILRIPLKFPRYFFTTLQSTSIKLAMSPSQSMNTISVESQLALKVEGVIRHGVNAGFFRKVQNINLTVLTKTEEKTDVVTDVKLNDAIFEPLQQTVEPHNDYFSAQFLLAFPSPNLYQVTVTVGVIDERGQSWETGPQSSLLVKAVEVPSRTHRR